MNYYCNVCDKTIKTTSKSKHLQSLTQNKFEKCIRIKQNVDNPDFSDIDEIFNNFIINHNEKIESYLVKFDFKLVFHNDFYPHINPELRINQSFFHLGKWFS